MNAVKRFSIISMSIFGIFLAAMPVSAATVISSPIVNVTACANITMTLSYGMYDKTTNSEVTVLQSFLHAKGYLSVTPTGYFGPLTLRAVKAFQKDSASGAVDGIVGVQTQAHIRAMDCQVVSVSAPTITALSPSSGPVGTVVTITGTGFTDSNVVHFAIGGISNIPSSSNGTKLTFTVPSSIGPYCKPDQACALYLQLLNAGTYPVSVENNNGVSAATSFVIIGNTTVIPG